MPCSSSYNISHDSVAMKRLEYHEHEESYHKELYSQTGQDACNLEQKRIYLGVVQFASHLIVAVLPKHKKDQMW